MARPAEPGRRALLDAGTRLISRVTSLASLSANAVVAEATLSKGAFFQHFPRKRDFVVDLHRQFHEALVIEIDAATAHLDPGRARLSAGAECYLDFCRDNATAKTFLFDARADHDLAEVVAQRNSQFSRVVSQDLDAMGWSQPLATARLVVAAIAEVALIENARGRRDRAQRRALTALFDIPVPQK